MPSSSSSSSFLPPFLLLSLSLSLSLLPPQASSQLTNGITCDSRLSFLLNSKNQNPCVVLSTLFGQCTGLLGNFDLTSLNEEGGFGGYSGPSSTEAADHPYNQCLCSVPVYNLVEACQDCQARDASSFKEFTKNCNSSYTGSDAFPSLNFPQPVPNITEVPIWALMDTSQGTWSESAAYSNVSHGQSEPTSLFPTWGPSASARSSNAPANSAAVGGGGSDKGATIGAAVGGAIGGILVLAGIFFAFVLVRRKAREQQRLSVISAGNGSQTNGKPGDNLEKGAETPARLQHEDIGAWTRVVSAFGQRGSQASLRMSPRRFGNSADYFGPQPTSPSGESSGGPFADAFAAGGLHSPPASSGGHNPRVPPSSGGGKRPGAAIRRPIPEIQSEDESKPDQYPTPSL